MAGMRLKSYHMKHPEKALSAETAHPKLEIQLTSKDRYTGDAIPWEDRHELQHQLDKTLVNCLWWADIGLDPDDPAYVADEYFDPADDREWSVTLVDDPIEEVQQAEQDFATLQYLQTDPTAAQQAVLELLATEGQMHYETLAEQADVGTSTVYRTAQECSLLRLDNGEVTLVDEIVRDQLGSLFEAIERTAEMSNQDVRELVGDTLEVDPESPFGRWIKRYGASIAELSPYESPVSRGDGSGWIEIDLSIGQWSKSEIKRILRSGGYAAKQTQASLIDQLQKAMV